MKELSLEYIVASCNGRKIGAANPAINRIIIDSREEITENTLFIALPGENYDGHNFVPDILERGVGAVIISHTEGLNLKKYEHKIFILVDDTLKALQAIASRYRRDFNIPVIAITGSVGKTTTKEILSTCLKSSFNTLYTEGNYNNDIGLPLTILRLEENHEIAVVELAMRAIGEIYQLAHIARPTGAIITNVEPVHLETLGSLENIAKAKCEVLAELTVDDFAFINGDNDLLLKIAEPYPCHKYTFGYNQECDCKIVEVKPSIDGMLIQADFFGERAILNFPLPAPKIATNVVAAVGTAIILGVPLALIINNLASYKPTGNRLNIIKLNPGGIIINDTYNANPVSMQAALETSLILKEDNKLIAVLGDMFELGEHEIDGHIKVGEIAWENKVDVLIAVGRIAEYIAKGALEAGMDESKVYHFVDKSDALAYLKEHLDKTEVVLFKASRGMQLETLINDWLQE